MDVLASSPDFPTKAPRFFSGKLLCLRFGWPDPILAQGWVNSVSTTWMIQRAHLHARAYRKEVFPLSSTEAIRGDRLFPLGSEGGYEVGESCDHGGSV